MLTMSAKQRIAKYLASTGLESRRNIEKMIFDKQVSVNGVVLETPATLVDGTETILVNGKLVGSRLPPRLWLYYKPRGLIVTHDDPEMRKTVFDALKHKIPRCVSVGRLDLDSEGLLLLSNVGSVIHYLESPKTGWDRCYKVRVFGKPDEPTFDAMRQGVTIAGIHYKPMQVSEIVPLPKIASSFAAAAKASNSSKPPANNWLSMTLTEGKNREIRRVLDHFGLIVSRLLRIRYGPFTLGDLKTGELREVPYDVLVQHIPQTVLDGTYSGRKNKNANQGQKVEEEEEEEDEENNDESNTSSTRNT